MLANFTDRKPVNPARESGLHNIIIHIVEFNWNVAMVVRVLIEVKTSLYTF